MEGVIQGRVVKAPQGSKVNEYLGIPFARPPVGDLRFHDPVRLDKLPTGTWTFTFVSISIVQCTLSCPLPRQPRIANAHKQTTTQIDFINCKLR